MPPPPEPGLVHTSTGERTPNANGETCAGWDRTSGNEDDDPHDNDAVSPQSRDIRKRSGPLVPPILRTSPSGSPKSVIISPISAPRSPGSVKSVHFNPTKEVRLFQKRDRPIDVSEDSTPADDNIGFEEFPFPATENGPETAPCCWAVVVPAFANPNKVTNEHNEYVRLENLWLAQSTNKGGTRQTQQYVVGTVVVANLAYQKSVHFRFTFDGWDTVSEVQAKYCEQLETEQTRIQPPDQPTSILQGPPAISERFYFSIELPDANSVQGSARTLCFCLRYDVDDQEYWDNNGGRDFRVELKKSRDCQPAVCSTSAKGSVFDNGLRQTEERFHRESICTKCLEILFHDF